jgi:hypothetical protein
MPRTRFSAALYLILVFASGILVGVVSHRLYVTTTVNADNVAVQPRTMDEVRKRYLADMRARVGVNDVQLSSVNAILDQTKQKFDDLHRQEKPLRDKIQQEQVESIRAVLTPEQSVAYDKWRADRARAAEAAKKKQQQAKK